MKEITEACKAAGRPRYMPLISLVKVFTFHDTLHLPVLFLKFFSWDSPTLHCSYLINQPITTLVATKYFHSKLCFVVEPLPGVPFSFFNLPLTFFFNCPIISNRTKIYS